MKKADAVKALEKGEMVVIGEYRSGGGEVVKYRDKSTGRDAKFAQIKHNLEFGDRSVLLSERADDNYDPASFQAPFKKGTPIVVKVETLSRENGVYKMTGKMEALTD